MTEDFSRMPLLPPRNKLHSGITSYTQRESPEQLILRLQSHVQQRQWQKLQHLLLLLKFMARCNPALASQLHQAGGVTTLLGVLRGVLHASPRPKAIAPLLAASLSLLTTVACADLESATRTIVPAVEHVSLVSPDINRSRAVLLVEVMQGAHSGAAARRKAARLLRFLIDAGHCSEALTMGLLDMLPSALENPAFACDYFYLQDVLWCMMSMVDIEVSMHGQVLHPQPLMRALMPLLYVLAESCPPHMCHVLGAVLRILQTVAVNDAGAKEQLQQLGLVDSLVRVICSDQLVTHACEYAGDTDQGSSGAHTPHAPTSGRTSAERAGCGSKRSSGAGEDKRGVSVGQQQQQQYSVSAHGSCAEQQQLSRPQLSQGPVNAVGAGDSWRQLWAAALLEPVLGKMQLAYARSVPSESGGAGVGVSEQQQQQQQQQEGEGVSVSAHAVCTFGLLLPLQKVPNFDADAHELQQWPCPIKEAFKGLLTMLCADDTNAQWLNDHVIVRAGHALVHLVAVGDMELAWQAANTLGHLATSPYCLSLLEHGVVEELTYFLQESADALHALTVRRQLEEHSLTGASSTHLPIPHSAYAYHGRKLLRRNKDRVHLVGRQRVTVNKSWCMYGSHAPTAMCDYCVPSACLRALLRLISWPAPVRSPSTTAQPTSSLANGAHSSSDSNSTSNGKGSPGKGQRHGKGTSSREGDKAGSTPAGNGQVALQGSTASQDVARRFVDSGGLYALFLLLHHELCGVHPSKMASSLLTLLNMVLDACPTYKDEVRKVGGLGLLTALMGSLARSDRVTDIFQLRVRICCSLQHVLEGNQANQLLAREHGLLEPIVMTLKHATSPDEAQVAVLDDAEQVTVSSLELLATAVDDSRGNQAAFIDAGGLPLLHDLLMRQTTSPAVLLATVEVFELLVCGCEPAKLALLGTTALLRLVSLANDAPSSLLAQHVTALCCRLVSQHPQGKAKVVSCGAMPLLLKMLQTTPYGQHTSVASQGLYAVTLGDVDLQNEVALQGGFQAIESLIRDCPALCSHALWLMCCLMFGNSYMKNEARQAGFIKLLLELTRAHGVLRPEITVPALHALAQMCQSNSNNQRAVVEEGGMSLMCAFLQSMLESGGGAASAKGSTASPAQGGMASAMKHPAVLDAVVRLLATVVEFNAANQALARESGCLAPVADLLMLAAEVHDLDTLRSTQLFPAVSAACAAVARAAQDCEANQQWLVHRHEDLAAALFRLLSVDEPYVALDASRALEFVAIRSDQTTTVGEDRAEFEADAVRAIVRIMHSRGQGPKYAPSAAIAAAAAVLGGSKGGPAQSSSSAKMQNGVTSYTVQEAARVLGSIIAAVPDPNDPSSHQHHLPHNQLANAQTGNPPRQGLFRRFTRAGRQAAAQQRQQQQQQQQQQSAQQLPAAAAASSVHSPPVLSSGSESGGSPAHSQSLGPNESTPQPSLVSLATLSKDPQAMGPHGWGLGQGGKQAYLQRQEQLQQQQQRLQQQQQQQHQQHEQDAQQQQQQQLQQQPQEVPSQNGVVPSEEIQGPNQQQQSQHQVLSQQELPPQQQHSHEHSSQGAGNSSPSNEAPAQPALPPNPSTTSSQSSGTDNQMCIERWTKRSGCSPTAFQAVAANVSTGPWHYVKLQLAWVLFILAAKSPANRELIQHLLRTVVTPLAQQLANVEAFYASDEAFAALTMQTPSDSVVAPLPVSTQAGDAEQLQLQQQQRQQQLMNRGARTLGGSKQTQQELLQQQKLQLQKQRDLAALAAQQQQQQQQQQQPGVQELPQTQPPQRAGPTSSTNPALISEQFGAPSSSNTASRRTGALPPAAGLPGRLPGLSSAASASQERAGGTANNADTGPGAGMLGGPGRASSGNGGDGDSVAARHSSGVLGVSRRYSSNADGEDEYRQIEAEVAMLSAFGSSIGRSKRTSSGTGAVPTGRMSSEG